MKCGGRGRVGSNRGWGRRPWGHESGRCRGLRRGRPKDSPAATCVCTLATSTHKHTLPRVLPSSFCRHLAPAPATPRLQEARSGSTLAALPSLLSRTAVVYRGLHGLAARGGVAVPFEALPATLSGLHVWADEVAAGEWGACGEGLWGLRHGAAGAMVSSSMPSSSWCGGWGALRGCHAGKCLWQNSTPRSAGHHLKRTGYCRRMYKRICTAFNLP